MIFTLDLAGEMTDVPLSTLRRWLSLGIVEPSLRNELGRRYGRWFSEDDLYLIATVAELGRIGVPLKDRKAAVRCLQAELKRGKQAELFVVDVTGDNVAVAPRDQLADQQGEGHCIVDLRQVVAPVRERIRRRQERVGMHGKITRTRGVQGGRPVIAGTRVTVEAIQSFARAGYDQHEIIRQYPGLTLEDIDAAIAFEEVGASHIAAD